MKLIEVKEPINNIDSMEFDKNLRGVEDSVFKQAVDEHKKKQAEFDKATDNSEADKVVYNKESDRDRKVKITQGNFSKMHLDESWFDDSPVIVTSIDTADFETSEIDKTPAAPENLQAIGIAEALSALIQSEWEAIDDYNSALATFSEEPEAEQLIDIIKDIVNEEHIHVGQLQKALEQISPNATSIAKGEKEAEGQLAMADTTLAQGQTPII